VGNDSCDCLRVNVNGYMGMPLNNITPNEEIDSGSCECLHSRWDHTSHAPEAIDNPPSHCRKSECDCKTYKKPQWRCSHCGGSEDDVWRGNKEKNQWICSDCWKNVPASKKKIITGLRKKRRFDNKLELISTRCRPSHDESHINGYWQSRAPCALEERGY
jgi:hypothetical protein